MKEQYIQVCSKHEVSIFHQPWWLDVVSNHPWEALVIKNKRQEPAAIFPYYLESKLRLKLSRQPALTPYLGVYLLKNQSLEQLVFCRKESNPLYQVLKKFHHLDYNFPPHFVDWRPFYNIGCIQLTRYTYVIENYKSEEELWSNLKNTVRTSIRNAQKQLCFKADKDIQAHIQIQQSIYQRQMRPMPFNIDSFNNLYEQIMEKKAGRLFTAIDQNGDVQGSILLVWDKNTVYNLMMGQKATAPNGTIQFLLWKAIIESKKIAPYFNFEGGMLKNIEPTFRHFGGVRVPYFRIQWDRSKLIKIGRTLVGK